MCVFIWLSSQPNCFCHLYSSCHACAVTYVWTECRQKCIEVHISLTLKEVQIVYLPIMTQAGCRHVEMHQNVGLLDQYHIISLLLTSLCVNCEHLDTIVVCLRQSCISGIMKGVYVHVCYHLSSTIPVYTSACGL